MVDPVHPTATGRELPRWLWIGLPLVVGGVPYVLRSLGSDVYDATMRSEMGLIENATVVFLVLAIGTALVAARRAQGLAHRPGGPPRWFAAWLLLIGAGSFYFAAEELSWGYHFFRRAGLEHWFPTSLMAVNDQGEPNLHNYSGWQSFLFDQGPRNLLTAAAAVGGVLVPVWVRVRRRALRPAAAWLWPTIACAPVGLFALLVTAPRKAAAAIAPGSGFEELRMGETKECLLALFLFLYVASVLARQRALARAAASTEHGDSGPPLLNRDPA